MVTIEKSPVHGTAVAVGERGFLLVGPSGSGKSGLALQMIVLGAELISDDQVQLQPSEDRILLSAPSALRGQIEARFMGILRTEFRDNVPLVHIVDLNTPAQSRHPKLQKCDVLGSQIDLIHGRDVPNLASVLMVLGGATRRI